MKSLLRSRKFLIALLDAGVSLATYFIGKYAGASSMDLLVIIGFVNTMAALVIVGITVEDKAALEAGTHITQQLDKPE